MNKLILLTLALVFVLETRVAMSYTRTVTVERIDELAMDDDPLTGVWEQPNDMQSHTLIEKHPDRENEYQVSRYISRYMVTTLTGKVKRAGNKVYLWNYYLEGKTPVLPEYHNEAYTLSGGKLIDEYGYTHYLVSSKTKVDWLADDKDSWLLWISEQEFETGEGYFQREIERVNKLDNDIPKRFIWSEKLPSKSSVFDFETLAQEDSKSNEFLIAKITSDEYPGKLSGHCGSSTRVSYYWANIRHVNSKLSHRASTSTLVDDWVISHNDCLDGSELNLVYNALNQITYLEFRNLRTDYSISECFALSLNSVSTKPKVCSESDIEYLNNNNID